MAEIWLMRHGQAGDPLGDYDRLSELGKKQCRLAGESLRHLPEITHVFCGEMRRHRESAVAFEEGFGQPLPAPRVDSGLNEYDHHSILQVAIAAGASPPQPGDPRSFHRLFVDGITRWISGEYDGDYNETYAQFCARVSAGFGNVTATVGSGGQALVFSSGGAISTIIRELLDLSPARAFGINAVLANASITRVRMGGSKTSLVSLNGTSHLDAEPALATLT